jgi:hypothetical protein
MEASTFPPHFIFLDFFRTIEDTLIEIINIPMILTFCKSIESLTIVFSDIKNNKEVVNYLSKSNLPKKEIDGLKQFFDDSFQTSFSYGYGNTEFVFIRLNKSSKFLEPENYNALKGLIIHELLHSVQRQRGLEVRLRNSLTFSLDFFSELASIIPEGIFDREEVINFLKQVSQFALFALKDIYVNVELIKRGFSEFIIELYKTELGFDEPDQITTPEFEIPFQKGEIKIKDLNEFARAYNYTVSLIPVWLPMMVLEDDSRFYSPSRKLKHFIFDKYYINPSLITREMWHIENIFLTSFSFSKSFHLKWFGAIFNLALEYLLGEDFVFYHLSKATELIEEIYEIQKDSERRILAMVPVLKAAYVHKLEYPAGIQQKNVEELEALMKEYSIDKDELLELEENFQEILNSENENTGYLFENLLQLSIMIISRDFRKAVLAGRHELIKEFGRTILTLLQAINYLGNQSDDKYYHAVRLTVKRIIRNYNTFKQKKLVLHLEIIAKEAIFTSAIEPTPLEVEELLFNYDFFEIPLSNTFTELGISFIHNIKTVLNKIPIADPEFHLLVSQFIFVFLNEKKLEPKELDQIDMILVSSLIATSGIPFSSIQTTLQHFLAANSQMSTTEEE